MQGFIVRRVESGLNRSAEILVATVFGVGGRDLAAETSSGRRQKMSKT